MTKHYGAWENMAARFTNVEAWVYSTAKGWVSIHPAETAVSAILLKPSEYRRRFPKLPRMPRKAFK